MEDFISNKKNMEGVNTMEAVEAPKDAQRNIAERLAQRIEKNPENASDLLSQEIEKGKDDIGTLKSLTGKINEDPENERSAILIHQRMRDRFEQLYESAVVAINLSEQYPKLLGDVLDHRDTLIKEYSVFVESSSLPKESLLYKNPGEDGAFEEGLLSESTEQTDKEIIARLTKKLEAMKDGNEVPKLTNKELAALAKIINSPEAQAKMKELEARGVNVTILQAEPERSGFNWKRALLVVGAGLALGVGITVASPAIGAMLNGIFGAGTWNSVVSFMGSATQTVGSFFSGLFSSGQAAATTSASGIQAGAATAEALSGAAATAAGSTGMSAATGTGIGSAGAAAAEALSGALLVP